jgi:CBS-domain-containing membrane protein
MRARDIMVSPVATVSHRDSVKDVAKALLDRNISAMPVTGDKGELVGIVSEGDLLHRAEAGTERRRSWWLSALIGADAMAADYVKAHARTVADVMTRKVISVTPEAPLHEVATLLEKHSIKRVPVVENGQLVGLVSRANLIQAVASAGKGLEIPMSDTVIRERLLDHLKAQPWTHTSLLNITVNDGVVDLWGVVQSEAERKALRVAAEMTAGVRAVNDNMREWRAVAGT